MKKCALILAALAAPTAAMADLYGDTPDAKHAWSVHDRNRPNPVKISAEVGKPPSDAIVLFDGSRESFEKNWCDGKGNPSKWVCDGKGEFYTKPGWVNVRAFKGSSDFDTAQMARFLDSLIQDAENLGIPTITDKEFERMVGQWGKNQSSRKTGQDVSCADELPD